MKKILVVILAVTFLLANQIPGNAANKILKGGKAITITFPGTVTLKKSGCQNIPVKYTVGRMPDISFAFLTVLDDADSPVATATFYKTPSYFASEGKIWKKVGSFSLEVCREDWSERLGGGEYQDHVGVSRGSYQVLLIVHPSIEEYSTIVFK